MGPREQHEGGCLCGAIRYRVSGPPFRTGICYCTQCRRQTGSPMAAFAAYRKSDVTLLSGQPVAYRASALAAREFCGACGSALFWRDAVEDEIDIFLGSLDQAGDMPAPTRQIWTQHRMPWVPEMAHIRAHRVGPPE